MDKISIIVPVLNEDKILQQTLSTLNLTKNEELIVVDGGSRDRSVEIAQRFTKKIYITERGRARQMNYGAERAEGDILLFLHADCILPKDAYGLIRKALQSGRYIAGAFDLKIDHPGVFFRLTEIAANIRSRMLSLVYGDQGLFLKRETFKRIGGFPEIPLMEDIEISEKLREIGKIKFLRPPIRASARRWLKEGRLYTMVRDVTMAVVYLIFRPNPERLLRYYKDVR
jgi:rSAM/selenodomain-associated transferase 2